MFYQRNFTEKQEFLIGTMVFAFLNATTYFWYQLTNLLSVEKILGTILSFLMGASIFYLHEISHHWIAKKKSNYVRFKLLQELTFLSFISALIPSPIKFVAPGLTITDSYAFTTQEDEIAIYSSGSLATLILAGIFLILSSMFQPVLQIVEEVLFISARSSITLSLFSLLPFYFFDGEKIFNWNKVIWSGMFIVCLSAYIILYFA